MNKPAAIKTNHSLFNAGRLKIPEIDEALGRRKRFFERPRLAQESDRPREAFDVDLTPIRQNFSLGLEEKFKRLLGDRR